MSKMNKGGLACVITIIERFYSSTVSAVGVMVLEDPCSVDTIEFHKKSAQIEMLKRIKKEIERIENS